MRQYYHYHHHHYYYYHPRPTYPVDNRGDEAPFLLLLLPSSSSYSSVEY